MAGFQFSYNIARKETSNDNLGDSASKIYYKKEAICLSGSGYPDYPLISWCENDFQILFEGIIYDSPEAEIKQKVQAFCAHQITKSQLQSWLHQRDGEFVLLIFNSLNQQLWLWNDIFGRLPVYLYQETGELLIGRDIQQIRISSGSTLFDAFGLASTMLLGYALGEKSLWKGISYLPPGALLKADFKANKLDISKAYAAYRFGAENPPKPEVWIESLSTALENRLEKLPNAALSLSGGLDSRLIAALLKKMESNTPAFTYRDAEGSAAADVRAVEQMIKQLQWETQHKFVLLKENSLARMQQLMQIKQGLNYAGMAFLLPFLEYYAQQKHPMITGDGGDKLLADLRPLIHLGNQKQLLNYLLRQHGRLNLETAAQWSGISVKVLEAYLLAHLESYNENPNQAYSQFLLRERARKWLFEGEDRNRAFCWTTTPFYGLPFARQALDTKMSEKAFGKLFLQLFQQLPGNLEKIVNPNWQQPLSNQKAIQQLYHRQKIKQQLRTISLLEKLFTSKQNTKPLYIVSESQLESMADYGLKINPKDLINIKNVDLQIELYGLALLANFNS